MTPTFTRRQALGVLGAGAATVVAGGWWVANRDDDGDDASPPPDAAEVLDPSPLDDALAAIGVAYLADHPEDGDVDQLRADLGAETDLAALLEAHADEIAAEHAAGTVVDVDGWVLAVTEARIGALASLR